MKKTLVVAALVLTALFVWNQNSKQPKERISFQKEVLSVEQKLGSETRFTTLTFREGQTALDLLQKTADVEVQGEGKNAFVTAINGKEASQTNREYWAFYVNGKLSDVGAGSYKLKDGDKIGWRVEKY